MGSEMCIRDRVIVGTQIDHIAVFYSNQRLGRKTSKETSQEFVMQNMGTSGLLLLVAVVLVTYILLRKDKK